MRVDLFILSLLLRQRLQAALPAEQRIARVVLRFTQRKRFSPFAAGCTSASRLAAASRLARARAAVRAPPADSLAFSSPTRRHRPVHDLHKPLAEMETSMRLIRTVAAAVTSAMLAWPAAAQQPVTVEGTTATETATIQQLDAARRFVVLRGADGSTLGVFAPPEFTRFNELRIGDTVTLTYYESIVYQVRSRHAPKPAVSEEIAAHESGATLPGATLSHQTTESVTVEAVNREVPSITVVTADRRVLSKKVENRSLLDGVKRGDRIDITYTDALLATVTRAK
jgi:hypothetical protein